ncbi:MAG: hypothetical protein RSE91_02520 [Bacilli bacterium]
MNIKFVINDYMLIWNILYQASINEEVHRAKQKLWINYKKQYGKMTKDIVTIYEEKKDFLPDDDIIYNLIFELPSYALIKKETEKYRLKLLTFFDKNKKDISNYIKKILRIDIKPYTVFVLHPSFNLMECAPCKEKINGMCIGEELKDNSLLKLMKVLLTNELIGYQEEYHDMVDAIIELAIDNELATQITKESKYNVGDKTLKFLKRQLYPYWLMYLGADHEKMLSYMMRDKIVFDAEKYTIEPTLAKASIFAFIDFCVKNQKYIIKLSDLEIR